VKTTINVLVLSYLFPNRAQPAYGIFVLNRLRAVSQFCRINVIAPIQWYPLIRVLRGSVWGTGIPHYEEIGGLPVYHPRFAVVPRYMKWLDAITYCWAAHRVMRRLRRKGLEFDLVDVHWTYPDIVAAFVLARKDSAKFVVTVRGHEALYLNENTVRRRLVAYFLRKAAAVITLSAQLRDQVIQLGVAPERVSVVLNGVDLSQFSLQDRQKCRRQLGLSASARILISVGRLTEGKGHQDLIGAVAQLGRNKDVLLYIIGGVNPEDDFRDVLLNLIADLRLTNIHLVAKVPHEQLSLWYGAADVFCLASKSEGCPNVVLEALACGTPVVATDVGSVSDVVESGENGFLVGPQHARSLPLALADALVHSWDRQAIAARMNQWGWAQCAERVYSLYRSVLREGA
jgi:teichuronic acid biosynthesis glycosyltransferase TuaC